MRIRTRIVLGFLSVIFVFALFVVYLYFMKENFDTNVEELEQLFNHMVEHDSSNLDYIRSLVLALEKSRRTLQEYLLAEPEAGEEFLASIEKFDEYYKQLKTNLEEEKWNASQGGDDARLQAIVELEEIKQRHQELYQDAGEVISLADAGSEEQATELLNEKIEPEIEHLQQRLIGFNAAVIQRLEKVLAEFASKGRDLREDIKQVESITTAILVAILLIALALSFFISGTISNPIKQLEKAAMAVEDKTFQKESLACIARRGDEVGELAHVLERMVGLLKLEGDLQVGRRIQVDFLLDEDELPHIPGWEIATRFHPAREVAGDFYDAFPVGRDKVGLVIADVCDKGVGAALFMALSRSLLRAFVEQHRPLGWMDSLTDDHPSPSSAESAAKRRRMLLSSGAGALKAVEMTNNYISDVHGDMNMFVTLFFGVLDPDTGVLTYVNGGHDPPAVVGPNGTVKTRLMPTGPAVGMLPDMDFDIQQITLEPGDLLVTFSDGVPDARNPDGERFTVERFLALLAQSDPSVVALLDRIETNLYDHIADADQFDDITMLAVRRATLSQT